MPKKKQKMKISKRLNPICENPFVQGHDVHQCMVIVTTYIEKHSEVAHYLRKNFCNLVIN